MAVGVVSSVSAFITKILCILFIIFELSNLVICGDSDDDSLQNALKFVERRQRDLQLQDNDYYGQPEDIGYGYQKNFGVFDDGPAREVGSPDSEPGIGNDFRNILFNYLNDQRGNNYDEAISKRKSNFRERYSDSQGLISDKEKENHPDVESASHCSYMQRLKDIWSKYRQSRSEDIGIEDLSSEQVFDILNSLYEKDKDSDDSFNYNDDTPFDAIPLRSRRNYRVFDSLSNRKKRYPSFGEGIYGKRTGHSQHINYEGPVGNEFLYALKFVNPNINREAVENLKDGGYEVLGDEKDRDVIRMLDDTVNPLPSDQDEEPYWLKREEPMDRETWLSGPVSYPTDDSFHEFLGTNGDKRAGPRIFKNHNGIHINNKRIPVKRSSIRSKKEVTEEKVSKEVENIFQSSKQTTNIPPKKTETVKKPTEFLKKQNVTKPEVTKHRDAKKLVRRANDYTKEFPSTDNSEIEKIFNDKIVDKKSIDWSQYFGFDKRSQQWLKSDNLRKAESYFLTPKSKRYMTHDKIVVGDGHFADKSQFDVPFDTRIFNSKKLTGNVDKNIDRMERKLGNIEDRIIDDAVKYTGAHTGVANEDLRTVKNEIVHHLEAAYSLEKMKNALEEFKNSMKSEKSFSVSDGSKDAATPSPKTDGHVTAVHTDTSTGKPEMSKSKRVSTKKEIENVYGKNNLDFLNWPSPKGSAAGPHYDNIEDECPVLEKSLNNCLKVDEITGKYAELLLPICSLQQICYLCGSEIGFSKPSACDLMYLTEAENLCQGNRACLLSARDSMFALRDLHEQDLMSGNNGHLAGSCLFNPCIQKYFMNTPAAVVPLEYQN